MPDNSSTTNTPASAGLARRAHLAVLTITQLIMAAELLLLLRAEGWMQAFLVVAVMAATLVPFIAPKRLGVVIPSELQILAILFIFATIFLGEVRAYYERLWWWDLALHATAGLLLGLVGFLVVYILNENDLVDLQMRPSFVALFAFLFSVGIGTFWEIFEFGMDEVFGLTMQKPMLGDPSGLTDTMWDLIVDALGAAVMSAMGWRYLTGVRNRRVDTWVSRFLARNPQLFRGKR